MINLAELRREYLKKGLRRHHLPVDPVALFELWLQQACDAKLPDANAMSVSTVDRHNKPSQRMVLLKHYDQQGFVFYTNLKSPKATHLATNPQVSLLFPWQALDRQVIINGPAALLPRAAVLDYFQSRPRDSQLAAWASQQSTIIDSREILENSFSHWQQQFSHGVVPLPEYWGGICVWAESFEFWQGRTHRLHDRFRYQRRPCGWEIARLAP